MRLHQLSELMDGEADAPSTAEACRAWRDDTGVRSSWHAWHVIGDVLRSEDLVRDVRCDAAFVANLRARLASEPTVLAPAAASPRSARRAWSAAAAVAAGVVAVAVGAGMVMGPVPSTAPVPLAVAPVPSGSPAGLDPAAVRPVAAVEPTAPAPTEPQTVLADGQLIRDAQLDRYLAAHKPFSASPAMAVQSSFVGAVRSRSADR